LIIYLRNGMEIIGFNFFLFEPF